MYTKAMLVRRTPPMTAKGDACRKDAMAYFPRKAETKFVRKHREWGPTVTFASYFWGNPKPYTERNSMDDIEKKIEIYYKAVGIIDIPDNDCIAEHSASGSSRSRKPAI